MASHITFIVLNSAVKARIVCDLAEKLFSDKQKLVIYSAKEEECKKLDTMLWTWKQQSFIPHVHVNNLDAPLPEPVVLTNDINNSSDYETLIMTDPLPMDTIRQFPFVIDFAEKYDEQALLSSRRRYKQYRDENFTIETKQPGEYLHSES